jgi:hypothetical protein
MAICNIDGPGNSVLRTTLSILAEHLKGFQNVHGVSTIDVLGNHQRCDFYPIERFILSVQS